MMEIKNNWKKEALVNKNQYNEMYKESLNDNDGFWDKQGSRLDWIKKYSKIKDVKFSKSNVSIKWFYDGYLNVTENCIDRHAKKTPNKTAIIWEGDDPNITKKTTYKELLINVSKINWCKKR